MVKIKNLYYGIVGLKQAIKQFKGINLKVTKANFIDIVTIEDTELSIHYVPDIKKIGLLCAGLYRNAITKHKCIMVDDIFMSMDKNIQDAVIAHELGHHKYGHIDNIGLKDLWNNYVTIGTMLKGSDKERNALIENTLMLRDYSKEVEADSFAIQMCGKEATLNMLQALYKLTHAEELKLRYEVIAEEPLPHSSFWDKCTNIISIEELDA